MVGLVNLRLYFINDGFGLVLVNVSFINDGFGLVLDSDISILMSELQAERMDSNLNCKVRCLMKNCILD